MAEENASAEVGAERAALSPASRAQMEEFCRAHRTQVLTILFSDLEGSTRQQSELGNIRAADLADEHRRVFREVLRELDGREVETAGDSFLAVFAAPSEGVKFALHLQAAMRRARETEPALLPVRVGVHQGQVVVKEHAEGPKPLDIYGVQVATAARIMDLGRGGQILCSRTVFDDARAILRGSDFEGLTTVAWCNHGPYRFQGVGEPYEVCEVGEEGLAPLAAPGASEKGWPTGQGAEEGGWRPAAGAMVPETDWVMEDRLGKEGASEHGGVRFRGEFGEVWKAWNPSSQSRQVFKFCFKRDWVPVLRREATLLGELRKRPHQNLVDVYDVRVVGKLPPYYLRMEYVEGPSLDEWLATSPPLPERLEIIAQVADALDAVHAAGVYHRDIKPSNILLKRREDGRLQAKLTDFGLGAAEDPKLLQGINLSRVDGVAGTWDYIAPELRTGGKASAQSDLYSLGVTLFQVAVGDLKRPLGDWEREVPSEVLREDIRRCLAHEPGQRLGRASELAAALRGHGQRVRQRELERESEKQRRRVRRLRVVVGVAGLFALVVLAFGSVATYQWRRANRLAAEARAERDEANRQRERAVRQKQLALDVLGKLTHDVPEKLLTRPDSAAALRELMEGNLAFLGRILALDPDTPEARRQAIVSYLSIGDQWRRLGDVPQALAAYEQARDAANALATADPRDATARRLLAQSHTRVGFALEDLGRLGDALEAFQASVESPQGTAPAADAAALESWANLGKAHLRLGHTNEALKAFAASAELASAMAASKPGDAEALHDLATRYADWAAEAVKAGRAAEAVAPMAAALKALAALCARDPGRASVLAGLLLDKGGLRELCEQVRRSGPATGKPNETLAAALHKLAAGLLASGSLRKADAAGVLALAEAAVGLTDRQVSQYLDTLATACVRAGRPGEAAKAEEEALSRLPASEAGRRRDYEERLRQYRAAASAEK